MKIRRPSHRLVFAALVLTAGSPSRAEQHIQDVLQHTEAAARSRGDSAAIQRHARDALDLIDEAKDANAEHEDVVKLIDKSEAELNSAVTNAARFNSHSAIEDATDAKKYLEAADQAAERAKSAPWPIERTPDSP